VVHPHQLECRSSRLLAGDRRPVAARVRRGSHPRGREPARGGRCEFAEVGIRHKTDTHGAYLIGVEYSLRNIADQIKPLISRYTPQTDRFLVYCFRGGKRSRLWADNLRTIGFEVDVLAGRLEELPPLGARPSSTAPRIQLPGAVRAHRVRQDAPAARAARQGSRCWIWKRWRITAVPCSGTCLAIRNRRRSLRQRVARRDEKRFDASARLGRSREQEDRQPATARMRCSIACTVAGVKHRLAPMPEALVAEAGRVWREDYPGSLCRDPQGRWCASSSRAEAAGQAHR
jgi:hypothetical protein